MRQILRSRRWKLKPSRPVLTSSQAGVVITTSISAIQPIVSFSASRLYLGLLRQGPATLPATWYLSTILIQSQRCTRAVAAGARALPRNWDFQRRTIRIFPSSADIAANTHHIGQAG